MRLASLNHSYLKFLKKLNLGFFKRIFFLGSLLYFCIYFFSNFQQTTLNINLEKDVINLFFSFLFCVLSIYFNAYAWKYIVIWFGSESKENNLVSFYVLTNILKYVPGGIWHFVERFNFLKKITNPMLAFYSTLIEPYFMLSGSFILATIGVIFSPLYFLLILPLIFLNRRLIYFVLKRLESVKGRASDALKLPNTKDKFERQINLISFFPFTALLLEIGFILTKFIGFYICFITFNSNNNHNIFFLLVTFSLSWTLGLIVPTAPSGIGVFEACLLFLSGKIVDQNTILISLISFRVISTMADLTLSLPFIAKKILKRI